METAYSRKGLLGLLRALRDVRRQIKANERPVISVDDARARYEPLMETLAAELVAEFGVEFRRIEAGPERRNRRIFETRQWVADKPLTAFPDWYRRLDAVARRVLDVVDPDLPMDACTRPGPTPDVDVPDVRGMATGPIRGLDDPDVVFMSEFLSLQDRLGGDVEITIDDDRTLFSAVASVKPA